MDVKDCIMLQSGIMKEKLAYNSGKGYVSYYWQNNSEKKNWALIK